MTRHPSLVVYVIPALFFLTKSAVVNLGLILRLYFIGVFI